MRPSPRLDYSGYLKLPDLLAQQQPLSSPVAPDELMFITVHQTCELWFKLLIYELTDARDQMMAGNALGARDRMRRCCVIGRLLTGHLDVIDTMTPVGFERFRQALGSGSGAQSAQFMEIEYLSGLRDPGPLEHPGRYTDAELTRLRRRLAEPTIWDGFLDVLAKAGLDTSSRGSRSAAFAEISRNREQYPQLCDLLEALLDHDQAWSMWRARHALTVERQIGGKPGTGGSAGAGYLHQHRHRRFYPELCGPP